MANGPAASRATAGSGAEQSPAVTMSEGTPEVQVTGSPAAEAGAADHGTEWPAATAAGSGGHDAAPSAAASAASAATPRPRADPGAAARMFDAATTRRRSVVFEEDDELDVPDFLK